MSLDQGFNTTFLGHDYPIRFPTLSERTRTTALNEGEIFSFTHFSIVMSEERKFAVYCAHNIDLNNKNDVRRCRDCWHFDNRIGENNQVGNHLYQGDPDIWDRGHLVTRDDVCWGEDEEAKDAERDSFCWANIAPQHHKFHMTDWGKLERWIVKETGSKSKKLTVFTGPIYTEGDREYCGYRKPLGCNIRIPAGFWKVVFYVGRDDKLHSAAFQILQDDYWRQDNLHGFHLMEKYRLMESFEVLEKYQVPLTTITEVTGIKFDEQLYDTNPLYFHANTKTKIENIVTPEAHMIKGPLDLILDRELD